MASKTEPKTSESTAKKGVNTKKTTTKATSSAKKSTSTVAKSSATKATQPTKKIRIKKGKFAKYLGIFLVAILVLVLLDFVVQYIDNDYSVAVINGERVPASEYEERLKESYGTVIATQLINETLIMQEAEREGLTVDDEEVDKMVEETIEQLGGEDEFQSALAANGLTEDSYRRNLRIQLVAEQLIVEEPTDEELTSFFTQYQEVYWTLDTKLEDVKDEAIDIYRTQKFNEESPIWLAELRAESEIQDNVAEKPKYGLLRKTWLSIESLNNRLEDNDKDEVEDAVEEVVEDAVEEKAEE